MKAYQSHITSVKATAFLFYAICMIAFLAWACIPLLNTLYLWPDGTGGMADIRYNFAWVLVFLIALNAFLPYLGLLVLANPESTSRSDLYYITSILMMFLNFIIILGLLGLYLFYTDVYYAGRVPFNDYRWCCVFYSDAPDLCPNGPLFPCNPAVVSTALRANWEFVGHLIAAIVFFVFSVGHYAANHLFRDVGAVRDTEDAANEGRLLGVTLIFVNFALFLYWAAVPLLNTLHLNGYPRFAIPPSPNNFETTLYGFQWWVIWTLALNLAPIVFFLVALALRKNIFAPTLHYWAAVILIIASFVDTLILGGIWIFDCNWAISGRSLCHDYRWCCKYFSTATSLCGNTTPCTATLAINSEFFQHFIFSIVFWVFNGIQVWLNLRMRHYGLFYNKS